MGEQINKIDYSVYNENEELLNEIVKILLKESDTNEN